MIEVNAYSLITAVRAVLPFAATNHVKGHLNGVHLCTDGRGTLSVEAVL